MSVSMVRAVTLSSGCRLERWQEDIQTLSAAYGCAVPRVSQLVLESPFSLDTSKQFSTWSVKQRRCYGRLRSGVDRALALGKFGFHLALTSAPGAGALNKAWDLLVKRVRRELNFSFEFCKVETSEGNGVIHAVCISDGFRDWSYDGIHAYFSCLWAELHDSPNVWVSVLRTVGVVRYITSHYIAGHDFVRMSHSVGWVFRGFVKKMRWFVKEYGFRLGIQYWKVYILEPCCRVFVEHKL